MVAQASCARTITADIVALDQVIFYNRLGAHDPRAMIFALKRDVIPLQAGTSISPGNVQLRLDKRPRPLTLRMNEGDCLQITLTNLLTPTAHVHEPATEGDAEHPPSPARTTFGEQPSTRTASVHVIGLQLVNSIASDGSYVGYNPSSLIQPGATATYTYYGEKEGTFLMYSAAATTGGEGDGGSLPRGLFGAINVEPKGAEWYRNQVTAADRALATAKDANGLPMKTPGGHPVINYNAEYPEGHPRAGLPILKMLQGNEIVHSDLDAIITGGAMGSWPTGTFKSVAASPNREKPFREFTVIFHDEAGLVQAFPEFEDPILAETLHGGRDNFAINYGSGGVGATVLANRKKVGPAKNCVDCKFEEFFLSSWAIGDPAMVVDVPANATVPGAGGEDGEDGTTAPVGTVATKVFYPDDPSGVHHSYIGDRVKIRNLHAGPAEHHVFHLHAHQWLRSPDGDNSNYMDSQGIGPGTGFTYEMTWGGSGNRNKTVGDAIFHCHFYPHFAQGMWELWRNHDVFEEGTELDANGIPVPGARALPDGEIVAGTPIPAVIPIPGLALPPMPTWTGRGSNPGYPFFIPGRAGHRPPRPPMDVAKGPDGKALDGGLPRHVVGGGLASFPELNRFDFHKEAVRLNAVELPEEGNGRERNAMLFHGKRYHDTWRVDPTTLTVTADKFTTNGLPAIAGAPFADPCVTDAGTVTASAAKPRVYKAAAFQMDVKYNKAGWHYPQHRMYALFEDVLPTMQGTRAPEPMFFRTNSGDCINFHLVNLIPKDYLMDDFQVTTPTDIVGQHIHLVKFDVTSSDGSANGWNYEDGSMSPGEVRERIHAINAIGGLRYTAADGTIQRKLLTPQAHPTFGAGPNGEWIGAMETIQRWYADATLNSAGEDRTLRTVFTHDHFGPSTHQQAGLYAGLVTEPAGSTWRDPETGETMGGRYDGGPTSWRADILTPDAAKSYREFMLEFQDFALAYKKQHQGFGASPENAISPPGKFRVDDPMVMYQMPFEKGHCPNMQAPPCPEIVSADDPGTMTANYRSEPIALRVRNPNTNTQAAGDAGDLSQAFRSDVVREDPDFNVQPNFYPERKGVFAGDPFTPLMRAYEGDNVQVRVLVGAHEEGHQVSVHGLKWLAEPDVLTSGYRNSQFAGISEHFEMGFKLPPLPGNTTAKYADYMWQAGASSDDTWNGTWGLLRAYRGGQTDLLTLPNNTNYGYYANKSSFPTVCPSTAPSKFFDVTAVAARTALPGGQLFYNPRTENNGPLGDSTAVILVRTSDLDSYGKLRAGLMPEPLIIRANAGDCVNVTLRNKLPTAPFDRPGFSGLPPIVPGFNMNQLTVSNKVGLHSQLLATDVTKSDGANVGMNVVQSGNVSQLASPGGVVTYKWYAGDLEVKNGQLVATPVEFGATNLIPSDKIKQTSKGMVGALIIQPKGAYIRENLAGSKASANIITADGQQYKDFVVIYQDDVNLRYKDGTMVKPADGTDDPEDSGHKAYNYRSEPLWRRMGHAPEMPLSETRLLDFTNVLSNSFIPDGGDPLTPTFLATKGEKVRFRVLQPGGHQRNHVFALHGHTWQEFPYAKNSLGQLIIGDNPESQWVGSQFGIGPTSHFDIVLQNGAGGKFGIIGDYLYRDQQSFMFNGGLWGLLRVR